ncbi:MAG: preprotein translocase subunit YajC [Planctomycetes bacterium]|nr:preprotein translocase subunit YajC [Planctomycetota bacterium]
MEILPMLGVMFLIFYFLLIRPQNKERRQQQVMRSSLKKGDKVLTQGGIVASIRDVKEKEVVLDIDGAKIRIVRDAVVRVLEAKDAETATV